MATFTLPNEGPLAGKQLNIPDDPNQRQQIANAIQQIPEYGPDVAKEYLEGTFLGQAAESLKGIPRGIAKTTLMGLRGPIETLAQDNLGEGPLVKLADKLKAKEEEVTRNIVGDIDPRYSDAFSTKAGQAIGSLVPFVGVGALASRGGVKYNPLFKPNTNKLNPLNVNPAFLKSKPFLYPAALGGAVNASNNTDMMDIAQDVYGEEKPGFFAENISTLFSVGIGASEALPIFNFFKGIPKSALRDATASQKIFNHARNFGTGAIQEGLQEATAGLLQDLNARGFYSDELPIGDSLFDDLTVGGFAGGVLNTAINYAGGRRGIASEYRAEKEKRAEKKKQDLLRTKKFDIATKAGNIDIANSEQPEGELQETLLLPLLSSIPDPVELNTEPQLQIINNSDNTFTLIDNDKGELNKFNKESEAMVAKQELLDSYQVESQKQILNNDLYSLGLDKSSSAFMLGQTIKDLDTTTVDLKEIVSNDSSLTNQKSMQSVLMGTNKKYKKLPMKDNYTFAEAKQILSIKDFNNLMTQSAQEVSRLSLKNGYESAIENQNKTNITIKKFKELAESKNINLNLNSPAFEYASRQWTGTSNFKNMSKPQKELLLARMESIPRFNSKINFPDFKSRDYNAEDVAEFVSEMKSNNMTFNKKSLKQGGRNDQFFDDLIYSGRAERTDTGQYRIKDNFQNDLNKKTEGFNETIEEFENRLTTENELSAEEIAELVAEESITRSNVISPEEQSKKTINFAESVNEGKINKFAQELKRRLNKIGLKETGVIVSDEILSSTTLEENEDGSINYDSTRAPAEGEYDRNTDIIFLSLTAVNPSGKATDVEIQREFNKILDHELIHALREKDLISEKEYDYLKKQTRKIRVPKSFDLQSFELKETFYERSERINKPTFDDRAKRRIFDSSTAKKDLYEEEAIAEMYRSRGFRSPLPPKAEGIYNKFIEFFEQLGTAMRISGFSNVKEVFENIESGQVGSRVREKIRTTKLLDKGPNAFLLDDIEKMSITGPRDESSGMAADYVPATRGPRASNLLEEVDGDGFSPSDIYRSPGLYMSSRRGEPIFKETIAFIEKLKQIKGNPNATITMYRASPTNDLRSGDLITPSKIEAQNYVNDSKITKKEVRDADRARIRQEQIDKTGVVSLQQEKNLNTMDSIIGIMGAPEQSASELFTYELKAGDVRWDGNQLERWGYFPSDVVSIDGSIPTFNRIPTTESEQDALTKESDDIFFLRQQDAQTISNLQTKIKFRQNELFRERGSMTKGSEKRIEKEIVKYQKQIAKLQENDLSIPSLDTPLFSRGQRFDDGTNTQENIQLRKALAEAEETVINTARGGIPYYNLNASDVALEAALNFNQDISAKIPDDIPKFSAATLDGVDKDIRDGINRTGSKTTPKNSMGYRWIDEVKDTISPRLKYAYNNFRTQFVDKLDKIDKLMVNATEQSEEVRRMNNSADTATMAALRMADKARGIFQGMLTKGYVESVVEGIPSLSNVTALQIDTKYNKFLEGDLNTGGLMQILAPLYGTETDLESIFKYYAMLKRKQGFDKNGRFIDTPVTQKDLKNIEKIQKQYPEVVEAYGNYQKWNNKLIDFASSKGILSKTRSEEELRIDISNVTKQDIETLNNVSYYELLELIENLNKNLSVVDKIETRGTAQIWRENSDYYPFYRKMADDSIGGPRVAGGALPNNPLSIKIEGSTEAVDLDVIEAISRNSLSILTAALKNDGLTKLVRDLKTLDMAKEITPKQSAKVDSIFVFENGIKQHYQVESIETFEALTEIGGTATGMWTQLFAAPSALLRDTVTRDPGFVAINILRDTLSSKITSGADFVPIVDSVKNMFADMHDLERFGVLGGYDFANDEGSVKKYINRTMRKQGLSEENGMTAKNAFFTIWDGLGDLTTKSDGATRLAVYNAVYKKLKAEDYSEAAAQSEAAYQALEIINFGRRGLNPGFRFITAAIPFLNARVQGLDVLWRSSTGQYSATQKLGENETLDQVKRKIQTNMGVNAGILIGITLAYYLMYHDDEEYKNLKREVRDDNWVLPIFKDYSIKIPIPFEVGFLFKVLPERFFDMTLGDDAFTRKSLNEASESISRGAGTSLSIPFFQPGGGLQILKPISEALNNRNAFTGQEIVPYYQQKQEPGLQSRPSSNILIKNIAEYLNISPSKVEHVVRGYTGTLGGHALTVIDSTARLVTGEPILPSNVSLNKIPFINRLLLDQDKQGGYQQGFYELRNEVNRAVQTMNSLKKAGRMDEYSAYRSNMQGVLDVKGQVRALDRYLTKWRGKRDSILKNNNMSLTAKSDAIRQMELERDRRLAFVPEMRKNSDIPFTNMGLF